MNPDFLPNPLCFLPSQCSLPDHEGDSFLPTVAGKSLSSKPSGNVWSCKYSLQLVPPSSL